MLETQVWVTAERTETQTAAAREHFLSLHWLFQRSSYRTPPPPPKKNLILHTLLISLQSKKGKNFAQKSLIFSLRSSKGDVQFSALQTPLTLHVFVHYCEPKLSLQHANKAQSAAEADSAGVSDTCCLEASRVGCVMFADLSSQRFYCSMYEPIPLAACLSSLWRRHGNSPAEERSDFKGFLHRTATIWIHREKHGSIIQSTFTRQRTVLKLVIYCTCKSGLGSWWDLCHRCVFPSPSGLLSNVHTTTDWAVPVHTQLCQWYTSWNLVGYSWHCSCRSSVTNAGGQACAD